ncbi:MAG: TIGR03088 family PEP-CTERM/XrtA system glycosyltransferase [Ectothiorhodospiraceae bacterium]|nr:TIGR03088 family PEP-CTERM/XrtA system glycosyltransferase [Chromatiales bacterium]MCP5157219.1 TIGR03088 family PEP-CTERM/XrtA system glycosyltransferase [Ectothiorhodospiraceae bacterium]
MRVGAGERDFAGGGAPRGDGERADFAAEVPLVAHVVFALRMGGLENGLVNLINATPPSRYRHAVICLTDHDAFASRIRRNDVPVIDLGKRPGHDLRMYRRMWRTLRDLRPTIFHTRNFAALDSQLVAALAGVRWRVHGEHGRDVFDLALDNARQLAVRKVVRPLVHRFVPLSRDLESYLRERVGVAPERISRICNGVDSERFHPLRGPRSFPAVSGLPADAIVIGAVGRMEEVKDPLNLARAFVQVAAARPALRTRLRLVMLGGGRLSGEVHACLEEGGVADLAWLPGARDDVPALLRAFDVFALPSQAEGISNTVLEAMASGVPVVATDVGGNAELLVDGETGVLVPSRDAGALAEALLTYVDDAALRRDHGAAGRARVESTFSLDAMVGAYLDLYDGLVGQPIAR